MQNCGFLRWFSFWKNIFVHTPLEISEKKLARARCHFTGPDVRFLQLLIFEHLPRSTYAQAQPTKNNSNAWDTDDIRALRTTIVQLTQCTFASEQC